MSHQPSQSTEEIHKNAGKPKNLWDLKDFSEEQQPVNCSGQTRDS